MVIRTNVMAMNAYRYLRNNQNALAKSLEKLSSGFRINRAADDPSGLAISERMKAQIRGLEQASANAQDGISLLQTAEGATVEIHNILNRMKELATKSANGTLQNEVDRDAIQKEMSDLRDEITRISKAADFNGHKLLDGSLSGSAKISKIAGQAATGAVTTLDFTAKSGTDVLGSTLNLDGKTYQFVRDAKNVSLGNTAIVIGEGAGDSQIANAVHAATSANGYTKAVTGSKVTFTSDALGPLSQALSVTQTGKMQLQIGDTNAAYNHVSVTIDDLSAEGLGLGQIDLSTQEGADNSLDAISKEINQVSRNRASLGSMQNRLEHTISSLDTTVENLSSANSRIRDTDMAKEMMNYARLSILAQVAQAMLAQANQQPNWVLRLLP